MREKLWDAVEDSRFLRRVVVGGLAVAACAGLYMDKHEVRQPEEAVASVVTDFSGLTFGVVDYEVTTYVDSQEIPVAAAGIGGITAALAAASVLRAQRKQQQ